MKMDIVGLSKSFATKKVLNSITLQFEEGKIYCLIGKNGAGKSTLFNIISGLLLIDEGEIRYNGIACKQIPFKLKQNMGFLNEMSSLIEELTVFQYLSLIGSFYNMNKSEISNKIDKLLNFFFPENINIYKLKIKGLSSGMKKKLEICSCTLHSPEFVLMDEPFSGLDPVSSERVITYILNYQEPYRTILFSSHNVDYIEKIKPTIILLDDSIIKFEGEINEFVKGNISEFRKDLLETLGYKKSEKDEKWV